MSVVVSVKSESRATVGRSVLTAAARSLSDCHQHKKHSRSHSLKVATTNLTTTITVCSLPFSKRTTSSTNSLSNSVASFTVSDNDFNPHAYWGVKVISPESFKFCVEYHVPPPGWKLDQEYPRTYPDVFSRVIPIPINARGAGTMICRRMYKLHAMSLKEKKEFFSAFPGAMRPDQVVDLLNSAHSEAVPSGDRLGFVVQNLCRRYFSRLVGRKAMPGAMTQYQVQKMIKDYLTEPPVDISCLDPNILAGAVGDGADLKRRWNVLSVEELPEGHTKLVFVKSFNHGEKTTGGWRNMGSKKLNAMDGIDDRKVIRQFTLIKNKRHPSRYGSAEGDRCKYLKTSEDWWKYPQRKEDFGDMFKDFEKNDMNLLRFAISFEGEDPRTGYGMLRELCLQRFALDHFDVVRLYDVKQEELERSVWNLKRTVRDQFR